MNSPLAATNDVRIMNAEIVAINHDVLGQQAVCEIKIETWSVFLKPLSDGDYAITIVNRADGSKKANCSFAELGLTGNYQIRDSWQHKVIAKGSKWVGKVLSHETKLFRPIKMLIKKCK